MKLADIYLKPGDWFFGRGTATTILGSCVTVFLWHPRLQLGFINHILLPRRPPGRHSEELDSRYADESMFILMKEIDKLHLKPSQFEAKLYGGGHMLGSPRKSEIIGDKNINAVKNILKDLNIKILETDVGGPFYRKLTADLQTGQVESIRRPATSFTPLPNAG